MTEMSFCRHAAVIRPVIHSPNPLSGEDCVKFVRAPLKSGPNCGIPLTMNSLLKFAVVLCGAAMSVVSTFAQAPLVNHGDIWRYHKGTNAPQAGWRTIADASLDVTWASGTGGFGYADNTSETNLCRTLLLDMKGAAATNYTTVYMRKQFTIASAVDPSLHLVLSMDFDDGFIAWLDGVFLTSQNVTGTPTEPAHTAVASGLHESSRGSTTGSPPAAPALTTDLGIVGARLGIGTHTLAIIGLNESGGSSDCIQIADLFTGTPSVPATNFWRQVNSPIVVPTNVPVGANATLVIEPGVTVQFGSGISLTVADGGRLLAEGTSNAPIRFTRSGASGSWGHVTINGSVGSPESRIAYAHFELNSASPTLEVAGGSAFLDHLTFGNTGISYIHVDGASFIISHCSFPDATAGFELVHGTGGIKSGGRGIFYRNFFGTTRGYNDVVDFSGGNRPGPIVQFFENVFTGSDDDALDLDSTDAWVEGNIFLHIHKNGAPDSSSAVSGGSDNASNSEITIVRNIFFDCDQAATAKQTNFYTFYNNTIVHLTHAGGLDSTGGVVNVRDTPDGGSPTSYGRGFYLEGNILYDTEQLVRNYAAAQVTVTFSNNLLPFAWAGPGGGNSVGDPLLQRVPSLAETVFTNWAQAQILWDWFSLLPGSPAIGSGPNGTDMGAVIPMGASISGEPVGTTTNTAATLHVGMNRSGSGIPAGPGTFPNGSGYTAYKWRLDGGAWSAETPINAPISLAGLASGTHRVQVSGKRDTTLFQDDPLLGEMASITSSRAWTVSAPLKIDRISLVSSNTVLIEFAAQANTGYTISYRDSLSAGSWQPLIHVDPIPSPHPVAFTDDLPPGTPARYYQLSNP